MSGTAQAVAESRAAWEPSLDGGQYVIRGVWSARITPTRGAWRWSVWHGDHAVVDGTAPDAQSAREACEERIAGKIAAAARAVRSERLGPRRSGRRQLPTVARLVALLQDEPRTIVQLVELLGVSESAAYQALSRARRRGVVISYEGTLGEGVYRVEVEG